MKKERLIGLVTLCGLFLAGGCSREEFPSSAGSVSFTASLTPLAEAPTKAASLLEGDRFPADEGTRFSVFGVQTVEGVETEVFDGVEVSFERGVCTYSPPRHWDWFNNGAYYDFLAVYPYSAGASRRQVAGRLSLSVHYDIDVDNYELLGAGFHRNYHVADRLSPVPLSFEHVNSAVGVVVVNNSSSASVRLNSLSFRNLMVEGDVIMGVEETGRPIFRWTNRERSSREVRTSTFSSVEGAIAARDRLEPGYDLMIPQSLEEAVGGNGLEANMPRLELVFTPQGGSTMTTSILLKDICRLDGTPITDWERGVRYTYYISMRFDGGMLVEITTTAWDIVEAETPGLLIPDDAL